ncbi:hypothetical protein [Paraburkholderia caffeinilytica]|uniref:hypothetical protein n=1 Tax=Paraburkholderia caffeinilytica TaxID=1761016 RepID=UPI003D9FD5FC
MRRHERIAVYASWYGTPLSSAHREADEAGRIDLGHATVELPAKGGAAHLASSNVNATRLRWVSGPPGVNVNVSSARRHWPDNILSCDFVDGPLADVARRTVPLHCTLITERRLTRLVDH